MNKALSTYLDLCRFLAALIVLLAHIAMWGLVSPEIGQYLPESGRDAVVLFFILSGFVITYTVNQKQSSVKQYLIDRATRIYSVAIPVLLLTVIIDLIGLQFNPDKYQGLYQYQKLYIYIPLHFGFFGEIWTISEQPFTVIPYWSLGYEVWYYILFVPLYFFTGWKRVGFFTILFLFVGYKLWLLYPIWLLGVWLFKNIHRWKLSYLQSAILFWSPIFIYFIYKTLLWDKYLFSLADQIWVFEQLPLGSARKFISDYFVAVLAVIHLYAAKHYIISIREDITKVIRYLASFTFTLYLVHAPTIKTLEYHFNYNKNSLVSFVFIISLVAIVTFIIGSMTERKKYLYKPMITVIFHILDNWAKKIIRKDSTKNKFPV
ncbi:acyltransferase family protein [Spartinivicinus ruber]|uniref:acyltransferase family protein n=1 Tax=Spartinivicinus ruber TaxID=2683272 RepID=UPI0013D4D190|nr:acyltransferase [Spartinivicinus ruber]